MPGDCVEFKEVHYRELGKMNNSDGEYSESWKRKIAHHLNLLSDSSTGVSLYKITADYERKKQNKPSYYVLGKSAKEAKQKFKNCISWLEIYGCEVCDNEIAKAIVSKPINYIVF